MCAIAGSVEQAGSEKSVLTLLDALKHRGPDDFGTRKSGNMTIGMARLRIRSSLQEVVPFKGRQGRVSYNGEIYGQQSSISVFGQCPRNGSEEVDLLFSGHGIEGMYAAALLNENDNTIEIRRDSYGIKPLFYAPTDKGVVFASEAAALAKVIPQRKINTDVAADCFLFGRSSDDDHFISTIKTVRPGQRLKINRHSSVSSLPSPAANYGRMAEKELSQAIEASAFACLSSDRPLGLALSGGLDSTFLAGLLSAGQISSLKTVSIVVAEHEDGISDLAELQLDNNGSWQSWQHISRQVTATNYRLLFQRMMSHWLMPNKMTSAPLYYALAETAAQAGIVVMLLGEGCDELFLGYEKYASLIDNLSASSQGRVDTLSAYLTGNSIFHEWACQLLGRSSYKNALERLRSDLQMFTSTHEDIASLIRSVEKKYSLEPLLERADIALMSQGIEGRTPYLHGDVPAHAENAGIADLIQETGGKRIVFEAARDRLGPRAVLKKKRAFRAPAASWFSNGLSAWAASELKQGAAYLETAGFVADAVLNLADRIESKDENAAGIAYPLLSQLFAARKLLDGKTS